MSSTGKILQHGQYVNTYQTALEFAQKMAAKYLKKGSTCRAACETTANMWRITYDVFESVGIEIQLANTFHMAIIAKTAKKTDKVDAEKIAQVLRMNMIPKCYVPDAGIRGLQSLIRQRIRLVQGRTVIINRVHSLLDTYGKKIDAASLYSDTAIKHMESLELESIHHNMILKQHARQIQFATDEIKNMDKLLAAEANNNEYARLLTSMTGVGIYSALLLAAEIADIRRFANPKKLVSWAGLCPTVHQSGDKKFVGKIKKIDRNKIVNWTMCEVANIAMQYDPKMKAIYESARKRHAGKHALAIVVVANKMVTIMWHMLHTRLPYQSSNEKLYQKKLRTMKRAG